MSNKPLDNLVCVRCKGYITVGDAVARDEDDNMLDPAAHQVCPEDPDFPPPLLLIWVVSEAFKHSGEPNWTPTRAFYEEEKASSWVAASGRHNLYFYLVTRVELHGGH